MQPLVITNRFIDGLKDEIKAVVMMQRPVDLDTACSLAILQEEIMGGSSKTRSDNLQSRSSNRVTNFSCPLNSGNSSYPSSAMKSFSNSGTSDDKKLFESPRDSGSQNPDNKFVALMAYRKAKGLCYKCVLKWQPGHK
jgi:hypothetical protein